ncbi:MAG: hypothetical protein ACLQED_01535 [Desulfobaccales bacterium]
MVRHLQLILAVAMVLVLTLTGTGGAAGPTKEECALAGFDNPAQLTAMVTKLKKAVENGDQAAVAAMVGYPIPVILGGSERDIENQADFINSYDAIMIEPVREAVLNRKLEDIFINRQGAMLTDNAGKGRLWLMNSEIIKIVTD